jgi:plasmid stabilization system protein ParE
VVFDHGSSSDQFTGRGTGAADRLADVLLEQSKRAAGESGPLIIEGLQALSRHPLVGRPIERGLRELLISRGRSGYVALYRYDPGADTVLLLRIRHQREGGFE